MKAALTIEEKKKDMIAAFAQFSDGFDKLSYLIALAAALPAPAEWLTADRYLVSGCQSKVWLKVELCGDTVRIFAYSDTLLVRGLLSMIRELFNGHRPEEVLAEDMAFLEDCGLYPFLSANRRSGIKAIMEKLHRELLAQSTRSKPEER